MDLEFEGEVFTWRGPAPHHFVSVPEDDCAVIGSTAGLVSYGWGMIPVTLQLGDTEWTTSLWPKDGGYLVPLKADVRRAEHLEVGDVVRLRLHVAT